MAEQRYVPGVGYNAPIPARKRTALAPDPVETNSGLGLGGIFALLQDTARQYSRVIGAPGTSSREFTNRGMLLPPWVDPSQLGGTKMVDPDGDGPMKPVPIKTEGIHPYLGDLKVQGDERVFMGKMVDVPLEEQTGLSLRAMEAMSDGSQKKDPKKSKQADSITVTAALNQPYLWSEDKISEVMKQMRSSGFEVNDFDQMMSVWQAAVGRASNMFNLSKGKNQVTPFDVLDLYKKERSEAGVLTDFQNGTQKTVQKTVDEITEGDAWSTLRTNLQQLLGRDPTDQEVRDFTYKMNNLASKNPRISETITKFKEGKAVSAETETSGGVSQGDMAKEAYDDAQDEPDYGAYQAASTYFNALQGALGPTVPGV